MGHQEVPLVPLSLKLVILAFVGGCGCDLITSSSLIPFGNVYSLFFLLCTLSLLFLKKIFKNMDNLKNLCWICYNIVSIYFSVFWLQGIWNLSPQWGIKPTPLALESKVLTTGPTGKSQLSLFLNLHAHRNS